LLSDYFRNWFFIDEIYRFILKNFVWCYDDFKYCGAYAAITDAGEIFAPRLIPPKEKIFDVLLEKEEYFNAYFPIKAISAESAREKVKALIQSGAVTIDNVHFGTGQYKENTFKILEN
jgi:hypothetical protein